MKKENKQVTVASAFPDHYEIYEDGSMKAWCKRCNNPEEVDADRAAKIRKIPDWSSSFTCTPCWKKSKEPENKDKTDQIEWGQAYNLAFESMLESGYSVVTDQDFFSTLERRQQTILAHIKAFKQKSPKYIKPVSLAPKKVEDTEADVGPGYLSGWDDSE